MEFLVIDAFVSACIRCFGHGIKDVATYQAFEDFDDSFLCAYDGLVGDVLPFDFALGFLSFVIVGLTSLAALSFFLAAVVAVIASFLALLITLSALIIWLAK